MLLDIDETIIKTGAVRAPGIELIYNIKVDVEKFNAETLTSVLDSVKPLIINAVHKEWLK